MLIVDVFGWYSIFMFSKNIENVASILITFYYILMHFMLRILIAYIGSTTMREPESLIEIMAKLVNQSSLNQPMRFVMYNFMNQFQVRKFELQTLFLTIDWNILLGVNIDTDNKTNQSKQTCP